MFKQTRQKIARLAEFVGKAFAAGLPLVTTLASFGILAVFGLSLIAFAGLVIHADALLVLTVVWLIALITFVIGAFRIWDQADRMSGAAPAGPMLVSPELRLVALIKDGEQLMKGLHGDPLLEKVRATQVGPWTSRVIAALNDEDPALARRFLEADEGTPGFHPVFISKQIREVMTKRLGMAKELLAEIES